MMRGRNWLSGRLMSAALALLAGLAVAQDDGGPAAQPAPAKSAGAPSETAPSDTGQQAAAGQEDGQEPAATVGMTNDLRFDPQHVTITAGQTILWRNTSDVGHTVTADPQKANDPSHVQLPEGAEIFDSGMIEPGGEYRRRFPVPGEYQYFCIPHEAAGMIGRIAVKPAEDAAKADGEVKEEAPGTQAPPPEGPEPQAEDAAKGTAAADGDGLEQGDLSVLAEAARRGEYLLHAGGCTSCHTVKDREGGFLAGGVAIESPFGTFYGPNITPHEETGIGSWSEADFIRAMTDGRTPEGRHYYPAFPYPWYTRMRTEDLQDLWTYLRTVPPVHNRVPAPDVPFPLNLRPLVLGWKILEFREEPAPQDPARSEAWNRGSYLVNALAHCGACHTPSNFLGLYDEDRFLAGSDNIPGGFVAPNITPHPETGIGDWSLDEIMTLLAGGRRPDGSFVEGPMAEMVADTTGRLTEEDRRAIATYLRTVEPVHRQVGRYADKAATQGDRPSDDPAR